MPRSLAVVLALTFTGPALAQDAALVERLRKIDVTVARPEEREEIAGQVRRKVSRELQRANEDSTRAWNGIKSLEDWRTFRIEMLSWLQVAVGTPAPVGWPVAIHRSGTIPGNGFAIDKLVFESRPGLWVTANLYRPEPLRESQPGLIICPAHHTAKTHPELQDMGMTWARAGCYVLVMDQLGHGERRQHPFASAADYPKPFRVGHADYYYRYDSGIQLQLVGETLLGWIAGDLMRGVDVLLAQPKIDPARILLLGSVAGGGDPAAVAGALDSRFAAVVPFNFGGPQPETKYPLPDDAEQTFHYAGGGSWESTRNLRLSAGYGTLPWVIVGSIAPRGLVYAHEFRWDRERDPVWKRLQRIYALHGHPEKLAFTLGDGSVTGSSATDTHCTHIGRRHRILIDEAFERWFDIKVPEDKLPALPASDLLCWTEELRVQLNPKSLSEILTRLADYRLSMARAEQRTSPPEHQRERLFVELAWRFGRIGWGAEGAAPQDRGTEVVGETQIQRILLTTEDDVRVPLVLVEPRETRPDAPVVLAICSQGKAKLWESRLADITALLSQGAAVCLLDPCGIGESQIGEGHGRRTSNTSIASSQLMLGGTLLGRQHIDVSDGVHWLRNQARFQNRPLFVWGESLVPPNPADAQFLQPRDSDEALPAPSQPNAPILALLAALLNKEISGVYAVGGFASFRSLLESPLVLTSYTSVVPGILEVADIPEIVAELKGQRVRLEVCVDGWNRLADPKLKLPHASYSPTRTSIAAWLATLKPQ